jgi:hypothetical protein
MPRRGGQFGMSDPKILLPLPVPASAHRHKTSYGRIVLEASNLSLKG